MKVYFKCRGRGSPLFGRGSVLQDVPAILNRGASVNKGLTLETGNGTRGGKSNREYSQSYTTAL